MKYAVVIEQGEKSFGAYIPDLPGCVAVGESRSEVRALIAEALAMHLEGVLRDGGILPLPQTEVDYVEVPEAAA